MKKSNKFISLVLVVLTLFVLLCGSVSASAEVEGETVKTTADPYFTNATTCTCEEHMNAYTTTVPITEPGFSLGEEDMSKVSELGTEVKGVAGILHKFFAKFYEILNKIIENIGSFGDGLDNFLK